MSISAEEKNRYLREAAIVLAREGFQTDRTHTGGLHVLLDGSPLCEVTESGGVTYRNEDTDIDEGAYERLRGKAIRDMKRTNGRISFKDAMDFQKSV